MSENKKPEEAPPGEGDDTKVEEDGHRVLEFIGGDVERLGGPIFNTFRIGTKWADIESMTEIHLAHKDSADDEDWNDVGPGMIIATYSGELNQMLDMHTGINHGCSQPMPADRKIELHKVLEAVYGRRLVGSEKCTVLYVMRPMTHDD